MARRKPKTRVTLRPLHAAIKEMQRRDRQALGYFSRLLSEYLGFEVVVSRRRKSPGRPPAEPEAPK